MDKIEKAVEIFRKLEKRDNGNAADIAKRMFFIQDRLSSIRN
ncbi:MAG: hypothetical protein ABIF18_00925 [archaeon]